MDSVKVLVRPPSLESSARKDTAVASGNGPRSGRTENNQNMEMEELRLDHLSITHEATMDMDHEEAVLVGDSGAPIGRVWGPGHSPQT